MPYSPRIKNLAYQADPGCWKSYSGMPVAWKQRMEVRRKAAITGAERLVAVLDKIKPINGEKPMEEHPDIQLIFLDEIKPRKPKPPRQPVLKIEMLLHFYAACERFAPEQTRTSSAYTRFVKELLREGLIERPTQIERNACPGWAYRTTAKGDALVNAICTLPMPVEKTRWIIPS